GAAVAGNLVLALRLRAALAGLRSSLVDGSRQRAHFRAVVETAGDAILACDADGRVGWANGSACRMFGFRQGEFAGLPIKRLLPAAPLGDVGTNTYQILGAAAASEGRRKDGSAFPVAVSISKVRVEGQKAYLAIIHDLTELAEARGRAEEASRAKSAFLRHMSHELRTPLNGILGMASALADSALDAAQRTLLDRLAHSGEALLALMEQVLDFSRLETGDARLESRPFSLRRLLASSVDALRPVAAGKGLGLCWSADDSLHDARSGDPQRLRAVLACLLGNAVKGAQEGEVVLSVGEAAYALAGEKRPAGLRFTVRGAGRAEADGLGLGIAARLVALMGGELAAEGGAFHVRLPLEASRSAGRPVLVALGDAAERRAVENVLRGLGLLPTGVSTGRAALAELARGVVEGVPFGLAVVEWRLPDAPSDDWLGQLLGRSGWDGPVLLLHDGDEPAYQPACVREALHRRDAGERLGELAARHLARA
ncbi:MAG: PAS domain S-box protein, partial [Gemmataceae bacterium]|nr:PAS domain S-box protein [Gemmataceae bacterium]